LPEPHFQSTVSQTHIRENYQIIRRRVARPEFSEAIIAFLYRQCEVVWFELDDISEAFQFFDSQNARGRDIEPHDLLKAFHLRGFPPEEDHLKAASVHQWEASESDALSLLFAEHLYRIRNWSRGEAARHFGKADIALFKGVSIRPGRRHPHIEALLLASRLKYLAAADMAWFHEPCLEFESRPLAQQAIHAVFVGGDADDGSTLAGEYSAGIAAGYDIISRRLQPILTQLRQTGAARHAGLQAAPPAGPQPFDAVLARFAEHLFDHVQIMRVAVPPRTDLNRYFEVMNNR